MVFKGNFLGLAVTVHLQKYEYFEKREFSYPFFPSIVYNNVAVTKQIYFLTTLLKSWVHISDNIAGLEGAPQYY